MRKNRVIEQNRCYHLVCRLAHRAFFLDDEEKDRAVALMRRVELVGTDPVCDAENLQWIGDVF